MTKNIFFDFDGTLINSSKRLYTLFMRLVPEASFTISEYWEIKRAKENQQKLLGGRFDYSDKQISAFKKQWMDHVEDEDLLALDHPFDGVDAFLKEKAKHYNLHLVTGRQSPEKVQKQLERFGWTDLFKTVLVTRQRDSKVDLIKGAVDVGEGDFIVGDTGEDIKTGQSFGMKTVAVTSGFLSKESLAPYNPDHILESVVEFDEVCSL